MAMFTSYIPSLVLATVLQVSSEISVACVHGWTVEGDDCYYVGRGKVSEEDAKQICDDFGASLAYVDTRSLSFVQSLLKNTDSSDVSGAWVSDYRGTNRGATNCAFLDAHSNWQKSQLPCKTKDYNMLYVCEGEQVLKDCNGYSCYTMSDERWSNPCNSGGRYLARIESSEEHQFVTNFLKNASQEADNLLRFHMFRFDEPIFIDGNDKAHEGVWVYDTGHKMTYLNWTSGEPDNQGYRGEDCLAINPKNYQWKDVGCNDKIHYLCEELDPAMW